ncbi:hypothetical protein AB0I84_41405 [Streptomyces spectabilis]|uniref:hypothetical protein n=1 Tax=Streptomyces spectabilis TaxID=68270 RepID=UPI0033FCDEDC
MMRNVKRSLVAVGVGAVAVFGLGVPQAVAAEDAATARLSCTKHVGGKTGWVKCTGKGKWRIISICDFEQDRKTEWFRQNGGTLKKNALKCWWDLADIKIERR